MADLVTKALNLNHLETLGGLLLSRLGLSSEQEELLEALLANQPIDETMVFEIARLSFREGRNVTSTDLGDVNIALSADGSIRLELGLYPEGADVVLSGFTLPELHRAQRSFPVSADHVVCGLELSAKVGAGAQATGAFGGKLALSAKGNLEAGIKFFKEQPRAGAEDIVKETLKALSTPFNVLTRAPGPGEIVVAEYHGLLQLGASFDYGWSTSGTKRLGTGLDNLDLAAEYKVDAKLRASAHFGIDDRVAVIVRSTGRDQWVNVSLMKLNERDAGLALNLSVNAELHTRTGGGEDVGAFVDSLLSRTRIPELMEELRKYDTREEIQKLADEELKALGQRVVDRVTGEIRGILEGSAAEIDAFLEPVREKADELLEAYEELDADVRGFLESALEKVPGLSDVEAAARKVADAESVEDLLELLAEAEDGDKIRQVLGFLSSALDFDLSQVSWLRDNFERLRELAHKVLGLDDTVREKFETAYGWLRKQLYVEEVVDLLKTIDETSVRAILDQRILWLETYLSEAINQPIDQLVDHLGPVADALGKVTSGYDSIVGKAKEALEKALIREIGLQASLAWQSVSTHEALVSVDLDLAHDKGREAMKRLMRGNVRDVMSERLTHADAIRFQKSYFLDELRRSLSLRVVLNGREDLRVKTALAARRVTLEPTDNGEIWVQESSAQTVFQRTHRRAMINVSTLFHVSLEELFLRRDTVLVGEGARIGGYDISYTFHKEIKSGGSESPAVSAEAVIDEIDRVLEGIAFQVVDPAALCGLREDLREIGQLGGELTDAAIDIRTSIVPTALFPVFTVSDSDAFQESIVEAWDEAVRFTYADQPALLRFYDDYRDDAGNIPQWGTARASVVNRIEWNDAFNAINSRGTFSKILRDLHRNVFLAVKAGDRVTLGLQDRLQKKLGRGLGKLSRKMRWVNSFERRHNERDFIMTLFANLVDESDRRSSLAVSYKHPISGEPMSLRIDEEPPTLVS